MKIKQIEEFEGKAKKVSENGSLAYQLWVDGDGKLYARIVKNDQSGMFTDLLYSVEEYAFLRNSVRSISPEGYSFSNMKEKTSGNNNDGGFLKAVLCDLLPKDEK
jgi:hypothetical protein